MLPVVSCSLAAPATMRVGRVKDENHPFHFLLECLKQAVHMKVKSW